MLIVHLLSIPILPQTTRYHVPQSIAHAVLSPSSSEEKREVTFRLLATE